MGARAQQRHQPRPQAGGSGEREQTLHKAPTPGIAGMLDDMDSQPAPLGAGRSQQGIPGSPKERVGINLVRQIDKQWGWAESIPARTRDA